MSDYLFLQSQDAFTETRTAGQYQLAINLAKAGNNVRVLLVQNGVTPARKQAKCSAFAELLASPVSVLADELALTQREISASDLKDSVAPAAIDIVVDAMAAGEKVIWN